MHPGFPGRPNLGSAWDHDPHKGAYKRIQSHKQPKLLFCGTDIHDLFVLTLTESSNAADEGESITVTVTAEEAIESDQTLSATRVPAEGSDETTAEPEDYSISNGTLNFAEGDPAGTEQTFTINLRADQEDEFDEEAGYAVRDANGNTVLEDSVVINDVASGQTFSLTTNADNLTGTEADDTFSGQSFGSLDSSDILDGAGGRDVLTGRFDLADNGSATTVDVAPTVSNIEDIRLTGRNGDNTGDDVTYDASSTTGAEIIQASNFNTDGTTGGAELVVDNVSQDVALGIEGGDGNADVTGTYNNTSGEGDAVDVQFSSAGQANELQLDGIETITLLGRGEDNSLTTLNAGSATTLNIGDTGSLTLDDPETSAGSLETIDASANEGGVTLGTASDAANDDNAGTLETITGGSGDDTIHLSAGDVAADDSIEGGEGTDTVRFGGGTGSGNPANVAGFEALLIGDASTYDLSAFTNSDIADVTVSGGGNATVSALDGETVTFVNDTTDFTLNGASSGNSATIGLDNSEAENAAGINVGGTSLATSDLETVTVESVDPNNDIDTSAGNSNSVSNLDVLNVNVEAEAATSVTTGGTTETVDASASSAGVTVDASSSSNAVTVDGGDGGDDITVSSNDDTVNAGAGDDIVRSSGGDDTVNLGTGDDVYVVNFSAGQLDGSDVNGGDGTDLVSTTQLGGGTTTDLTSSNAGALDALTDVEQFRMDVTGSNGTDTLNVDDATSSAFGGSFDAVVRDGDDANDATATVDASGTVLNSSSVNLSTDLNDSSGTTVTYQGGNAIEDITLSGNGDTVEYATTSFLSSEDSIDGGDGADTLEFTEDTDSDVTVTADQLSGVSGIETLNVNDASQSNSAQDFSITIDDAFASANANSSDVFTFTSSATDDNLTFDGSAVSDSTDLNITGSGQADTLSGGAGEDTIDGGAGDDTLTGGDGADDFVVNGTNTGDITDFDFGDDRDASNPENVDQLDVSTFGFTNSAGRTDDVHLQSDGGFSSDTETVVVLDENTFDAAGVDNALANLSGSAAGEAAFVIWQDGLGNVRFGQDADVSQNSGTNAGDDVTQLGTLDNDAGDLDITGIADTVDSGDFVFS